jgi:predicted Ser/Thr protein kinase
MIGRAVGHYRIEESLGKGGMGVVYKARDTRLDRVVALKFLPEAFAADPDRKRRFFQEARAASAVNHPAIAQIYDVGESDDGLAFIAMEFVEGQTVRALLQARELDVLGAVTIAAQVSEGLAKAHEAGIVHRDIKAENVMVTRDGHAKLLDFGLAKLLEVEPEATPTPDGVSHLETLARTQAGMVVGTLRYMSPEQARGQAVDRRSDVFSLGILLYEMVTGQLPFSGASALDTLHAIAFEEWRPVTQVRANVPLGVQRVLARCLRKRPDDRYSETRELASDLRALQREIETGITRPVSLGERLSEVLQSFDGLGGSLRPLAVVGALAGLMALVVFFARHGVGDIIGLGLVALFGWRYWRNRDRRVLRKLAQKLKRIPEVRVVAFEGQRVTVVVDKAVAHTYLRVHVLLEATNAKLFWGRPFTAVVRDDLDAPQTRALFAGSGVLYVRKDVLGQQV